MFRRPSQHHCFVLLRFMITFLSQGGKVFLHIFECLAIIFVSQSMSRLLHSYVAMTEGPALSICLWLQGEETGSWTLQTLPDAMKGAFRESSGDQNAKTPWCRKYGQWYFMGGMENLQRNNLTSLLRLPQCCRQAPSAWANPWSKQTEWN